MTAPSLAGRAGGESLGKDVAEAPGYSKSRNALAVHVDGEDKKGALNQGPLGGAQKMTVINESGL